MLFVVCCLLFVVCCLLFAVCCFMQYNTQSVKVLPANERSQFRWNANPFILDGGGDGMSEFDAGSWLTPYWMARYHGILGADDHLDEPGWSRLSVV
jgi:hypothetical protein